MKPADTLHVGDVMRWSLELLEQVTLQGDRTALVRVKHIQRATNGEVMVWMENIESSDSGPFMRLRTGGEEQH